MGRELKCSEREEACHVFQRDAKPVCHTICQLQKDPQAGMC